MREELTSIIFRIDEVVKINCNLSEEIIYALPMPTDEQFEFILQNGLNVDIEWIDKEVRKAYLMDPFKVSEVCKFWLTSIENASKELIETNEILDKKDEAEMKIDEKTFTLIRGNQFVLGSYFLPFVGDFTFGSLEIKEEMKSEGEKAKKEDKRKNKDYYKTNKEKAYSIFQLFGRFIEEANLSQEEQQRMYVYITGASGIDIEKNKGGNNLGRISKMKLDDELKEFKEKLKLV